MSEWSGDEYSARQEHCPGGSAFGLEAATGVVRYLEERGVGFDTRVAKVPIVPAAIFFDLSLGDSKELTETLRWATQPVSGPPMAS